MKRQPATQSDRWFDRCPRCSGVCDKEPGASRCRLCGRVWYVKGEALAQMRFEQASGLVGAREMAYTPTRPTWRPALRPIE